MWGVGVANLTKMFQGALIESKMFEQRFEGKETAAYLFKRASFAERRADAKALRCKCVWSVRGKPKRLLGLESSG